MAYIEINVHTHYTGTNTLDHTWELAKWPFLDHACSERMDNTTIRFWISTGDPSSRVALLIFLCSQYYTVVTFRGEGFHKASFLSVFRILWHFGGGAGSGSGSADLCLWLMDPDPAIFVIDFQDANKKLILFLSFSAYYFLKGHHFSKIKSLKEVTKQWESRFFLLFLLADRRIRIRIRNHTSD